MQVATAASQFLGERRPRATPGSGVVSLPTYVSLFRGHGGPSMSSLLREMQQSATSKALAQSVCASPPPSKLRQARAPAMPLGDVADVADASSPPPRPSSLTIEKQ